MGTRTTTFSTQRQQAEVTKLVPSVWSQWGGQCKHQFPEFSGGTTLPTTNSVSVLAMNLVVQSLFVPALSSASDNSRTHIISSHNPYNYFSA